MKKFLFSFLTLVSLNLLAQQTITDSITYGGINRSYILYVPASYTPGTPAPLVFNFHGYTSNASSQMVYGDFRAIADTAGFLIVHPQGTLDTNNNAHWNSHWGGTVDDIGFTEALIDSLKITYSINLLRVYSTGMSNGGFMSYSLACALSHKIAAIASVTGAMNNGHVANCTPQHPTPVMEIHGTSDNTVPYNGITGSIQSTANTLNYWITYNNCSSQPIVTTMPNTSTGDACTAEHYHYKNGDNGVEVEHYKIINGGHTWPGAPVVIGTTNYDISASEKIWEFFNKYDLNGRIVSINEKVNQTTKITLYPVPATDYVTINSKQYVNEIEVLDITGKELKATITNNTIDLSNFKRGTYFVKIYTNSGVTTKRFVKQ